MDEWKRSGQIPAFGNWDFANELPITQYFECARQAGLVRHSSSSGESDPYVHADRDLYALDFKKHPPALPPSLKKTRRNREKRCPHGKEYGNMNINMKKQGKVWDVTEQPPRKRIDKNDAVPGCPPPPPPRFPARPPKPVDEDLYKIPPELLHSTKRNKMLGFISRCLVPSACVS